MKHLTFTLDVDFREEDCEKALCCAERLLSEDGILCRSRGALDLLASQEGIQAAKDRLTISSDVVRSHLAECIAASLFIRFCFGQLILPGLRSDPFDLRFGNYAVGSPQYVLMDAVTRRLYVYVTGRDPRGGAFLSLARWPDAQAVHDHVLSGILQALQGARRFSGSGQLSHDEVFSPEIVVIDRDILKSVEWLVQGVSWRDGVEQSLAVLRDGLQAGQFLEQEESLTGFRDWVIEQDLFLGMNLGQWREAGRPKLIEEASRRVEGVIAERRYSLSPEQQAEMDRIYQTAIKNT